MDFSHVLAAYRTFNPAGWVSVYRLMPTWLGILSVVLGLVLLLFGGGKAFRFVAAPAGALIGFLWTPVVAEKFGVPLPPNQISLIGAAVLSVSSFVLPPVVVYFGFGLPAGFFAGNLVGPGDWLLGFLPAFLAVGAVAAVFTRYIGGVLSSIVGAWLLVIGALAALHSAGELVNAVASQPWGVILAAALFAVAGSIFQLFVRPSPEEAEKLRIEKAKAKRRAAEKRELEKRWSTYGTPDD